MLSDIWTSRQQSSRPIFRGRKLVLNYTNGSPCPSSNTPYNLKRRELLKHRENEEYDNDEQTDDDGEDIREKDDDDDDDDDDNDDSDIVPPSDEIGRKSTIMSFLCDRDPVAPSVTISFVGTSDSCAYFFEVRSPYACGGAASSPDEGLGPAGVFGVMYVSFSSTSILLHLNYQY